MLEQHTQKDLSKNELAHVLLIGGTHNKQGSNDARVRIVVLLTLSLIKSHKYSGAVLLTNIIVMADKHNIPKGKMHSNCRLLPEDIVCKITQRNNIRRANICDPALKHRNEEITSDIQKHKQTYGRST